ncbi:1,2-phenylacetyl-CoA epoxidase subunit B [Streptomyces sp. NPDC006512]|uniref:1,2-phenylacetyl-CoA epoxidase subunit B n=1 Tax=Streptomyces sp. NPDC006512 TaxID=3154307 RepID=UPI0033B9FA33
MSPAGPTAHTTWEVFVRMRRGMAHQHVGSVRGTDSDTALAHARDLFTRRDDPASLWVVPADAIRAATPAEKPMLFSNAGDRPFRYADDYVPLHGDDRAVPDDGTTHD